MLPLAMNLAVLSLRFLGKRSPLSVPLPTCSPTPSGGRLISNFFSIPLQPRATIAARTRDGLESAPHTLISNLVDFAEAVGGAMSRIDAALCSKPQETVTGAQKFSTRRL